MLHSQSYIPQVGFLIFNIWWHLYMFFGHFWLVDGRFISRIFKLVCFFKCSIPIVVWKFFPLLSFPKVFFSSRVGGMWYLVYYALFAVLFSGHAEAWSCLAAHGQIPTNPALSFLRCSMLYVISKYKQLLWRIVM